MKLKTSALAALVLMAAASVMVGCKNMDNPKEYTKARVELEKEKAKIELEKEKTKREQETEYQAKKENERVKAQYEAEALQAFDRFIDELVEGISANEHGSSQVTYATIKTKIKRANSTLKTENTYNPAYGLTAKKIVDSKAKEKKDIGVDEFKNKSEEEIITALKARFSLN